jgi:hypothetical protein
VNHHHNSLDEMFACKECRAEMRKLSLVNELERLYALGSEGKDAKIIIRREIYND